MVFIRKNPVESVGNRLLWYLEKYAAITTEKNRNNTCFCGGVQINEGLFGANVNC